jgi:hypothetical protein
LRIFVAASVMTMASWPARVSQKSCSCAMRCPARRAAAMSLAWVMATHCCPSSELVIFSIW